MLRYVKVYNDIIKARMNWLVRYFQPIPGQPTIAYGLRAALGLSVPIGLGLIAGHLAEGLLIALAVYFVLLADGGGAYRHKAQAMLTATVGVALATFLASLVHSIPWLYVLSTFFWVFIAGLAGLYGNNAATASFSTALMFLVAPGITEPTSVLTRLELCLVGGAWAMVLSLGLWVLHVYKPVVRAVADCYLTLSVFIELSTVVLSREPHEEWEHSLGQTQDNIIQQIEAARSLWASVRMKRLGASRRGVRLLVLLENANQIAHSIVAMTELLEIASAYPQFAQVQLEIKHVLEQLESVLRELAIVIAKEGGLVHLGEMDRAIEALEAKREYLRIQPVEQSADLQGLVSITKVLLHIQSFAQQLHANAEYVKQMKSGKVSDLERLDIPTVKVWDRRSVIETLQKNFSLGSIGLRHALRLALTTAIAVSLALWLHLPHGYWVAITVLVILKPDFGATSTRAVQRMVGTTLGGLVAIALASVLQNQLMLLICLAMLTFLSFTVRFLNYGIFVMVLTPVIILLIDVADVGDWQVGVLRILDTLLGSGLAWLGGYLLFPSWERQRLPTQLTKTIRANLAYFQSVIVAYEDSVPPPDSIRQARRQAELENANAAVAAQRLLNEPRHIRGEVEPVMTAIIYMRRFYNSVTTLAEHLGQFSGQHQLPDPQTFATVTSKVLENLADALESKTSLQSLPNLDADLEAFHTHIQQLHTARLAERAQRLIQTTLTVQAIREHTLVATELDRIANAVTIIHSAFARLL